MKFSVKRRGCVFLTLLSLPFVLIFTSVSIGVFKAVTGLWKLDSPEIYNSEKFLKAGLAGNEQEARSYLSEDMKLAVKNYCPDAKVTACLDEITPSDWGGFDGTRFVYASGGAIAFDIFWIDLNGLSSVVILMTRENGKWVVAGWRGFSYNPSEHTISELLVGRITTNEFPPPTASPMSDTDFDK